MTMLREWIHAVVWLRRHRRGHLAVPDLPFMRRYVSPGDAVVDVGAHAGSWCLPLAKWVPQGRVLAFEALPYYAACLRHLMLLAGARNVTIYNEAATATPQTVRMVWQDAAGKRITGLTHIAGRGEAESNTVSVPGVPLDRHLLLETRPISLLKCDVEGAELGVFQGARESLKRWQPAIYTELSDELCQRYGYRAADVASFLGELGYAPFAVPATITDKPVPAEDLAAHHDLLFLPAKLR